MVLQAIVWDYDGTIAPTFRRQESWFKYWAGLNDVEWSFENFLQFRDFYNETCIQGGVQKVYDDLGLPCNMADRNHPVWPAYEQFNQENPSKLYSGIKETFEQIWELGSLTNNIQRNRRLRMGINTTNSWKSIYADLKKGGLIGYIDGFITEEVLRIYHGDGNADSIQKPSTISLALMLGLLDSNGNYALHIGDTLNDLKSSQKVMRLNPSCPEKLITVGACYGYEGREKLESGVETSQGLIKFDYLIENPKELVPIIQDLI